MLELVVFAVVEMGISGLAQLYVALNITSLLCLSYYNLHITVKLSQKYLGIARRFIKDVPHNPSAYIPTSHSYRWGYKPF
jgi:hypothetical protein